VEGVLDRLGTAAAGTDNLVPAIIDAVRVGATLGEVSDRLRQAWGAHRELVTI
jgi:methylmalonyl-CoA mutase N-terminal domain/subunit